MEEKFNQEKQNKDTKNSMPSGIELLGETLVELPVEIGKTIIKTTKNIIDSASETISDIDIDIDL